jgi:hypothetical protein
LRFCVGDDANLSAFSINQTDICRGYLVVGQRLFTVAFALDTAGLPSRFFWWRQYSGLLRTIGHFLQYKQVREFTARGGDSQVKRKVTNLRSGTARSHQIGCC